MYKFELFYLAIICASYTIALTTTKLSILFRGKIAFAGSTELFNSLWVHYLALNDLCAHWSLLARRLHYELRHGVWVCLKGTGSVVLTHMTVTE